MEKIEFTQVSEILDEVGLAKVSGMIDVYYYNHQRIFTRKEEIALVKGFGLPSDVTIAPIDNFDQNKFYRFQNDEWVIDEEYASHLRLGERELMLRDWKVEVEARITRFERMEKVNRLTDSDRAKMNQLIGWLLDSEEWDLSKDDFTFPELD